MSNIRKSPHDIRKLRKTGLRYVGATNIYINFFWKPKQFYSHPAVLKWKNKREAAVVFTESSNRLQELQWKKWKRITQNVLLGATKGTARNQVCRLPNQYQTSSMNHDDIQEKLTHLTSRCRSSHWIQLSSQLTSKTVVETIVFQVTKTVSHQTLLLLSASFHVVHTITWNNNKSLGKGATVQTQIKSLCWPSNRILLHSHLSCCCSAH